METRRKQSSLHASDGEVQHDLQLLCHSSVQQAQSLLHSSCSVPIRTKRRRTISSRKIEDLDGVLGFASFLSENEACQAPAKRQCKWDVPEAWMDLLDLEWSQNKCEVSAAESRSACRHVAIATFIKKDLTAGLISSH